MHIPLFLLLHSPSQAPYLVTKSLMSMVACPPLDWMDLFVVALQSHWAECFPSLCQTCPTTSFFPRRILSNQLSWHFQQQITSIHNLQASHNQMKMSQNAPHVVFQYSSISKDVMATIFHPQLPHHLPCDEVAFALQPLVQKMMAQRSLQQTFAFALQY